ncbi:hypothetical protein QNH20_16500 [Neobacillus sp. WH10]|uniref:hypothetical protein n=1 Tax=Neobacillus sp. WH10 TaxID=3047873 RepID=UPI0024C0F1A1|nr:hypothetical protein [Neobacillus sp. WH10]WHY75719.1 hypothetical protein QNH20_16500 [Neobacillus sp. WH10]
MNEFVLAIAFVFLAAVLKYAIARPSNGNNFFLAAIELPVDILFACIAFLATYIVLITNKQMEKAIEVINNMTGSTIDPRELAIPYFQTTQGGVLLLIVYLFLTTIVIICWRKSEELFSLNGINTKSILITGIGYLLTLTLILFILSLIKAVK